MQQSLQHLFSQIPRADIQRSVFDRHHTLKSAFDSGYLVPIYVDEALPGDTFSLNLSLFGRLSTMAVPIMDNLYMETFFFAVPYRLVWNNFQKFMGEQENPGDSTDYVIPVLQTHDNTVGSLSDYFGLPVGTKLRNVSCLWHRAYNLIYNEWFRDENLIDSAPINKDDGPDSPSDYILRKRRKAKDYFTASLPWPQKGPGMSIPIGTSAPVWGDGSALKFYSGAASNNNQQPGLVVFEGTAMGLNGDIPTSVLRSANNRTTGYGVVRATDGATSGLYADLSSATFATINQLREAFQIQRLYEADARGGTRYTEITRSHFGVISPDARLQRPEYLGGSSTRINVHPVAQQSATNTVTPQGNLAAYATMGDVQHIFTKSFTEHTLLIGLINVRADLTYQQGIPRMFSRRTRFDHYWPTLAHLGEQAVLNKEIYTADDGTDAKIAQDNSVFGYQERWSEYRYGVSKITGKMRSGVTGSLDVWHLAQNFTSLPALNQSFVEEDVPLSRVLAVTNEPQIIFDADFDLRCARPMPVYSVPGLIDHF